MKPTVCLLSVLALTAPARLAPQEAGSVARRYDATLYDTAIQKTGSYNIASYNVASYNVAPYSVASYSVASYGRSVVHWGKWLAAAGAVAFTLMGSHEHENANREFERLLAACRADSVDCLLGPDGRYLNPASERTYQTSIRHDRRARTRLMAGQASLLLAAGLFVADLVHEAGGPGNKPFAPLKVSGDVGANGARVGVRLTF